MWPVSDPGERVRGGGGPGISEGEEGARQPSGVWVPLWDFHLRVCLSPWSLPPEPSLVAAWAFPGHRESVGCQQAVEIRWTENRLERAVGGRRSQHGESILFISPSRTLEPSDPPAGGQRAQGCWACRVGGREGGTAGTWQASPGRRCLASSARRRTDPVSAFIITRPSPCASGPRFPSFEKHTRHFGLRVHHCQDDLLLISPTMTVSKQGHILGCWWLGLQCIFRRHNSTRKTQFPQI